MTEKPSEAYLAGYFFGRERRRREPLAHVRQSRTANVTNNLTAALNCALRLAQASVTSAMPKRRADADGRRFFDEFQSVRVSRLRASGVIDPAKRHAVISFGNKQKLIGTAHVRFPNGGGYSYFCCPGCGRLAGVLYLVNDTPRCARCCAAMGIAYRTRLGFGRRERQRARDQALDRLVEKVETKQRLRFKPAPASWGGKCQLVYGSRNLTNSIRRRQIELRLSEIASQQASSLAKDGDTLRTYQPSQTARQLIDVRPIWRASSTEQLQQALDKAQTIILAALKSSDPKQRLNAAKLMMRTKQARERGF
jgi:hypothetical protein